MLHANVHNAALMVGSSQDMGLSMEALIIDGDLSRLSPEQRVMYYKKKCESLRLNYLTKPFAYIRLNGKLVLYALKDCAEQLRYRDGVSIYEIKTQQFEGVFVVTAYARNKDGKEDVATGAVSITGLKGEALANALMKAETKAKRRVTLSICGLGITDESEIDSIPNAKPVPVDLETGETEDEVGIRTAFGEFLDKINTSETEDELRLNFFSAFALCPLDEHKRMLINAKDRRKEALRLKTMSHADYVASMEPSPKEVKDESVHYI